jgi:O-antigen/teichoic acid export membrane protein
VVQLGHDHRPAESALGDEGVTGTLRQDAIRGAKWVIAGRIVAEGTAFVALVALARLLEPSEVGHAAVAMVVFALAAGFLAGSFGSALVREHSLSAAKIEVAMLLSIATGTLLTGICCAVAVAVAPLVGSASAAMIALASPCFIVTGLSAVPQALRLRRLAFRAVMIIECVGSVAGALCAVSSAALGVGSASMVLGGVVASACIAILSLPRSGALRPRWHRDEARAIVRFGAPASAASIMFTAARNLDYALIAMRLPAADVGFYYRAYTLAVDYQLKVSNVLVRVLFPVLSRAESTEAFRTARSRAVRLHAVLLFPLLAAVVVTAPDLVQLLFGDAWQAAVAPTQILVGAGVAAAIGTGVGPVVLAAGRPRALLVNNAVSVACLCITVWVCASHGIVATCIGVVAFRLIALIASQYWLTTRLLGIPLRQTLVHDPGPAFVSAAAMLASAYPVFALTHASSPALAVASTTVVGLAVYVLVLRTLFEGAWSDVRAVAVALVPTQLRRVVT